MFQNTVIKKQIILIINTILYFILYLKRSQWPRDIRHELSWPAETSESWVRISLGARIFMCVYSVFGLSCVGNSLATG
jgi:hypothetical protein